MRAYTKSQAAAEQMDSALLSELCRAERLSDDTALPQSERDRWRAVWRAIGRARSRARPLMHHETREETAA